MPTYCRGCVVYQYQTRNFSRQEILIYLQDFSREVKTLYGICLRFIDYHIN